MSLWGGGDSSLRGMWYLTPLPILGAMAAGRWAIRLQTYGRIYEDDIALLLAVACAMSYGIVFYNNPLAWDNNWSTPPAPRSFAATLQCVLFGGCAAVKLSLLYTYRELFSVSVPFRQLWTGLLGWIVVSTLGILALSLSELDGNDGYNYYAGAFGGFYRPVIASLLDGIGNIMLLLIPLWIFPSIHLQHSINWWITLVYTLGCGGWSLVIAASMLGMEGMADPAFSSLGLNIAVFAIALVGYTPVALPQQKYRLWPWCDMTVKGVELKLQSSGNIPYSASEASRSGSIAAYNEASGSSDVRDDSRNRSTGMNDIEMARLGPLIHNLQRQRHMGGRCK